MIYSVWNQGRRLYDYFETKEVAKVNAPIPHHVGSGTQLGVSPDMLAWPLPSDAVQIGSGALARGMIAQRKDGFGLGAVSIPGGNVGLAVLVVGGILLYRSMRGR